MDEFRLTEKLDNERLLERMHALREDKSTQNMLDVLTEAAGCRFIVPVETRGGNVSFQAVGDKKGRRFLVVFSDTDSFEINKSREDQQAIIGSFEDITEAVVAPGLALDGMLINPGAEEILFGRELIESIRKQMEQETSLKIGDPDEYPPKLLDMAVRFCEDQRGLRKMYARFFEEQGSGRKGWFFILDMDADNQMRQYIVDTFSRYIRPYVGQEELIAADIREPWAADAANGGKPIYEQN